MCVCVCVCVCCIDFGADVTWTKAKGRYCKDYSRAGSSTFRNLAQAQAACLKVGPTCHGVYDSGCDGRGNLYLCESSSFPISRQGSCVLQPTIGSCGWMGSFNCKTFASDSFVVSVCKKCGSKNPQYFNDGNLQIKINNPAPLCAGKCSNQLAVGHTGDYMEEFCETFDKKPFKARDSTHYSKHMQIKGQEHR